MVKLVKPVQEKNECHYDKTKIEVELEHAWKDEPLVEVIRVGYNLKVFTRCLEGTLQRFVC